MKKGIKNIIEDTLVGMNEEVANHLNKKPAGMNGLELEEMKEEVELCLDLLKNN